jgi:hypothetical protein
MIRSYSYQDIPPALRAVKAGEAMRRLQAILSDPLATTEQRAAAQARQQQLRQWAAGTLPQAAPPVEEAPPVSTPENHTVLVEESLSVDESP